MDNIYKAVQLTIDSQNLALSKRPTHVYIANQYVDTNDTPLITAPFIIQKALENGTGVVDIVSSTIGSIYEVRLLCDAEVLISGYFYMPPMNAKFSELELYTSYPPRTPPVINEFWQKTENFILEKTNTLLNFVQVFNSLSSMRLSLGYLEELLTTKKSNLVGAINEVYKKYEGVGSLYEKNVAAAGAGANGWTDLLIKLANGRNQHDKNSEVISVKDFGAKGDGVTDDTASVNALSLFLAKSGGGTVFFPESDKGYSIQGSLYVTTDVKIDVNNQTLIGNKTTSMFKTANVVGGNFVEITTFDPYHVIENAKISDVKATNSAIVFDLKSFTSGCSVKNVYFDNCVQGFKLDYCFYSRWENLNATPTSGSSALPFYHLVASSNAMIFDRVTATVAWCWLIEGGNTALLFNGCTFEGGAKGFKFKGDCLGLKFQGCYFEAVTGTLFDFSQAGVCIIDWDANYINGVDVIFDDGGADTTSHLFGTWAASNTIVNVGQTLGTGFTFRGLMKVDGARNNIKFFTATYKNPVNPVKDANWITGKHTNLQEFANASVDGKANIMAKADIYTGVIPVKYSGDFGTPYVNQIPFTTKSTLATGNNQSITIDTRLVWQPLSLFAKVLLEFRRAVGGVYQVYHLYGDIYGSNIELKGGIDPSLTASGAVTATLSNNNGNLRITLNNIQNPNGELYITGTIRAVS